MNHYRVDVGAMEEATRGIRDTLAELESAGLGGAAEGRGFSGLKLSSVQLGPADVTAALSEFCDRWSWGVRSLVQDGNEIAVRLGLNAGAYRRQELYVEGLLKDVASAAVMGDPHQAMSQTEKESWDQVWGGNPLHADYSAASAAQAEQHIEQVWAGEGTDLKQLGERALLGPAGAPVIEAEHITGKDVL